MTKRQIVGPLLCCVLTVLSSSLACDVDHEAPGGDDPAILSLIQTLLEGEDPDERRWAAVALGQHGAEQAVPALTQALWQDEDRGVRSQSVIALGMIGAPEAIGDLVKVLEEDDEDIRGLGAQALGVIGDERALTGLHRVLVEDRSPNVRHSAATALGQIGSGESVDVLAATLAGDGAAYVRVALVVALAAIGVPESVPPLVGAFEDADAMVRWEAVKATGALGEVAREPLLRALWLGQGDTPWLAAMALERAGGVEARAEVDRFLNEHEVDLREVSENYRTEWHYGVVVLALERHGSWDMADYYADFTVDKFDDVNHAAIVSEAARDWLRRQR